MHDHRRVRELHPPLSSKLRPRSGALSGLNATSYMTCVSRFGKECLKATENKRELPQGNQELGRVGTSCAPLSLSEATLSVSRAAYMGPLSAPHVSPRHCLSAHCV